MTNSKPLYSTFIPFPPLYHPSLHFTAFHPTAFNSTRTPLPYSINSTALYSTSLHPATGHSIQVYPISPYSTWPLVPRSPHHSTSYHTSSRHLVTHGSNQLCHISPHSLDSLDTSPPHSPPLVDLALPINVQHGTIRNTTFHPNYITPICSTLHYSVLKSSVLLFPAIPEDLHRWVRGERFHPFKNILTSFRSSSISSAPKWISLANSPSLSSKRRFSDEVGKLDERRQWLDAELENVLSKKQAMEQLEAELAKREAILKEREQMMKGKSELEIKKLRSSQVLTKVNYLLDNQRIMAYLL